LFGIGLLAFGSQFSTTLFCYWWLAILCFGVLLDVVCVNGFFFLSAFAIVNIFVCLRIFLVCVPQVFVCAYSVSIEVLPHDPFRLEFQPPK